jgi:hypothetical protein
MSYIKYPHSANSFFFIYFMNESSQIKLPHQILFTVNILHKYQIINLI